MFNPQFSDNTGISAVTSSAVVSVSLIVFAVDCSCTAVLAFMASLRYTICRRFSISNAMLTQKYHPDLQTRQIHQNSTG